MSTTLAASRREYDQQQRLTATAVAQAVRVASRGVSAIARVVRSYQAAAVAVSVDLMPDILAEQGLALDRELAIVEAALLTGARDMEARLAQVDNDAALSQFVQSITQDANRTARAVDQATRSAVTGHVRHLQLPSCGRCVILAGRMYRWSDGFLRHPQCDCLMTPVGDATGQELVTDPAEAFAAGHVRGLSKADVEAVNMGADLTRVVNVRSKKAGLSAAGSVTARAGRLTPQGCLSLASDRTEALELLTRYGYVRST